MKKAAVFFLAVSLGAALYSQDRLAENSSAHYEISGPEGGGDSTAAEMEARFEAYNQVFRFDPSLLAGPLKVRVFTSQDEYDAYVSARLGGPRPGAVYLHYSDPGHRELVIHRGSAEADRLVPHQAFIQFLRGFIPQPPGWIREGFAIYFSSQTFDRETASLGQGENLDWLETAKKAAPVSPEAVFLADKNGPPPDFPALAWSLAAFFMAAPAGGTAPAPPSAGTAPAGGAAPDYRRALTDAFMVLSPSAGAEENAQAVYRRITLIAREEDLSKDYNAYLGAKKTFPQLVTEGQAAYGAKNFSGAGDLFRQARELKKDHPLPYYYLGLLAYEGKDYTGAEALYQQARDRGADKALIQYALGVNAAAAGKTAEAVSLLKEAAAADPGKYKSRTEDLIKRLQ
ncbi:MAG: tetratricopeptide repeat protein [Treponema sp.]|nr:tetratricopeptide repeat protein [Treponema sp.]